MVSTINMWSDVQQAVVAWSVTKGIDPDNQDQQVIIAVNGEERKKYSPNTTDDELAAQVAETNMGHQ